MSDLHEIIGITTFDPLLVKQRKFTSYQIKKEVFHTVYFLKWFSSRTSMCEFFTYSFKDNLCLDIDIIDRNFYMLD